jgi:hypothetical protein
MRNILQYKPAVLMLALSLCLAGSCGAEQGDAEQKKLVVQKRKLNARVETLKQEQDYLVFQKTMYESDSKYLIINFAARNMQLKYKNRVLKDVPFKRVLGRASRLSHGALTLTQKIEGPRERNLLIFGQALVLQGKYAPSTLLEEGIPRMFLSRKDFLSVYYAIESGAKAFILL